VPRQYVIMLFMLHVGLTGNIAAGKTHAAQVFAELGAHVIDADLIAHGLLSPGTPTYRKVVEAFGAGILRQDTSVDRKILGRIVFDDQASRLKLNGIVHPAVHSTILERIMNLEQQFARGTVLVHAALLIESGHYKMYDRMVVVTCDPALQLSRVVARDGLTLEDAKKRLQAQMPAEEKLKLADYTIDTSGSFRETREQIEAIYQDLLLQEMRFRKNPEA
jgi:dephospho-CoA kinase